MGRGVFVAALVILLGSGCAATRDASEDGGLADLRAEPSAPTSSTAPTGTDSATGGNGRSLSQPPGWGEQEGGQIHDGSPTRSSPPPSGPSSEPPRAGGGFSWPQGARLAYADDHGLWAVSGDEGPRLIASGRNIAGPLISPDGSMVLYHTNAEELGISDLWIVGWDGSGQRPLLDIAALRSALPVPRDAAEGTQLLISEVGWTPDNATIAFNTRYGRRSSDGPRWVRDENDDLWTVSVSNGQLTMLLDPGAGGHFAFLPGGDLIAVTRNREENGHRISITAIVDADGGDRRELFQQPAIDTDLKGQLYPHPIWLPDGEHLYLTAPQINEELGSAFYDSVAALYRVSTNGEVTELLRVAPGSIGANGGGFSAHWSPDLTRLAYLGWSPKPSGGSSNDSYPPPTSSPFDLGDHPLVIADADGSNAREYALVPYFGFRDWSPDGRRFLLASQFKVGGWAHLLVGETGHAPEIVGEFSEMIGVRWIGPDHLVYESSHTDPTLVVRSLPGQEMILTERRGSRIPFDVSPARH